MPDLTLTEQGARIGTPAYFAPEQFTGTKHDIDHRTDLYASGILLFQVLTGSHPYLVDGMKFEDLMEAALTSTAFVDNPFFQKLPEQIKIIIIKLLSKERSKRPHTGALVSTLLTRINEAL